MQHAAAEYLFTFPSNLRLILAHCRDAGITIPSLRSVWTFSEMVDDSTRALCREVLGVRIVHNYSSAETGYIALQCPECDAFHVQSEFVLFELLDEVGRACPPGQIGRVVITPLHNFAMPLLRYELGDEAEFGGPCPCGRGLPVLARIVGRIVDYLTLPFGRKRRLDYDHARLARIAPLREYQFIQHTRRRIEVLLVLARDLTPQEDSELHAVLDATFGMFSIEITRCESIPRTAAGKLRPFLSKLPQ
jgi:phenylacetate-CoA ligase